MLIRRKIFSESAKEVWEREKAEEIERNKERDKILKKLPDVDKKHADKMWKDTDAAGRIRTAMIDRDAGLVGAGIGYAAAKVGKHIAKKKGKTIKHGALISLGAAAIGNEVGVRSVRKKSERRGQDIWNEGDERLMKYIKSDPKTREKLRKNYKPISPLWTKELDKREDKNKKKK